MITSSERCYIQTLKTREKHIRPPHPGAVFSHPNCGERRCQLCMIFALGVSPRIMVFHNPQNGTLPDARPCVGSFMTFLECNMSCAIGYDINHIEWTKLRECH